MEQQLIQNLLAIFPQNLIKDTQVKLEIDNSIFNDEIGDIFRSAIISDKFGDIDCVVSPYLRACLSSNSLSAVIFCFELYPQILSTIFLNPNNIEKIELNRLLQQFFLLSQQQPHGLKIQQKIEKNIRIPFPDILTPYWIPGIQIPGWISPLSSLYSSEYTYQMNDKLDTESTDKEKEQSDIENNNGLITDKLITNQALTFSNQTFDDLVYGSMETFHSLFPFITSQTKRDFCDIWTSMFPTKQQTSSQSSNEIYSPSQSSYTTFILPQKVLLCALWIIFTILGEIHIDNGETKKAAMEALNSIHLLSVAQSYADASLLSLLLKNFNFDIFFEQNELYI